VPSYSWQQAVLRDWRFWAMSLTFFLAPIAINGTITQLVALFD
jgi:hypothetical protein